MNLRSGYLAALLAGIAWTAGLLVLYRAPFDAVAAAWRLGFFFLLAWSLGLVVLRLWFHIKKEPGHGGSAAGVEPESVDPTTGLPPRDSFYAIVREYLEASIGQGEKSLIGIVGVRNLEEIARSRGSEEAERIMVRVSRALFDSLRGADLLGRHGESELIAFLPKASSLSWETISERICGNVETQGKRAENYPGVVVVTGHGEFDPDSPVSLEELVREAYEEMRGNTEKEGN
jgi:diguanylate cyclase (GGDEF)-like protein